MSFRASPNERSPTATAKLGVNTAPSLSPLRLAAAVVRVGRLAALLGAVVAATRAAAPIDFSAQIRPLLNQNCTSCHGGVKAAGDVSFVYRDVVQQVGKKSGRRVIVPGQPEESELIRRITATDPAVRMPPAEHAPALAPEKIALLREWIRQGATWEDHWAFVPPVASAPPRLSPANEARRPGEIDRFVLARLEREGIAPAAEADRAAWLRRVSFDLTGLPPTPEETAAFAADRSPAAFAGQVDRLLASPHFGERWASLWLDLARYADTKGYEKDTERTVWPYRDWLVGAFNRNLPYDRFVIEQIAGDLLPEASLDQRIASSFHRQTQVNDEGGTDDEEYRIAAVIDRVATTWAVSNAVTFGCVQCHSHPYDPIRAGEYYSMFAFFNGTKDADFNSDYPVLRLPADPARHAEAEALRREIATLRGTVVHAGRAQEQASRWTQLGALAARASSEVAFGLRDGVVQADGTTPANVRYEVTLPALALSHGPITALKIEARPAEAEKAAHTPERGFVTSEIQVQIAHPDGAVAKVEVGRFFPDTENFTTPMTKTVARPLAADQIAGSSPAAAAKAKAGNRKGKAAPAAASTAATTPAQAGPAAETRDVTLDFHFSANPTISGPRWVVAALRQPLVVPPGATLRVSVTHGRGITEKPAPIRRLAVAASGDPRWNALAADTDLARQAARHGEAMAELARIPGVEVPVSAELPAYERRETRTFVRGNFLEKSGPPVAPGVPALFPPLAAANPDRRALAEWFFQPGQPLTARVAVNRFWEQLFGTGLVATLEDFGSAGERPSHPELLDWLAVHFERDLRWDVKALLREIVTSAAYRQDARFRPELGDRDPQNRLLARGPRQRLTAEMVRDQSLAASGLLSRKLGGPPVMPPQPPGVWQTVYNSKNWVESTGPDRYRRALYTFWKRSAAYPGFLSFDLPTRDLCTARRTPTNTPLQALVTLNDVVYREAGDALADRAARAAGAEATPARQIALAFEWVVSRPPTDAELARLLRLHSEISTAATRPAAAAAGEGATQPAPSRAMAAVASAILNLDAAFIR